ncbi:hypothetical protein F441_08711 [Phytophthora nicotianae CJ01A1]|uniref:START domain-containing protein n=3 Tax=Phytophthora nicotianae TaxID=4792 RepID=V9F779_PHYNI|nr:hypothetical protein F443_08734 [Phytophthora nicotianae P1569]ETM46705.1 hypothetical protein L914_08449 [Phytophthora nicotianae]ETP16726.1 hypothetical protein F441_08711 [Phytophthora nicotianae CJ01A1]
MPGHSVIDGASMTTVLGSSTNDQIPVTPTPSCSSSTTNPDGSSDTDSDLFLSLFDQPSPGYSPTADRGGRPYPYTRSKTRWRKRPNDELKYLRGQVVELESLRAALSHSDSRPRRIVNQSQVLHTLCEENHANKLQAALNENRKLRAMVASNYHLARSLQAAIDEQLRLRAGKISWPNSTAASDELIFALLDEEKDRQFAMLDKVLEDSGIARVFHSLFSSLQLQHSENGLVFQHNEVRLLPFSVTDVARSLRHCLSYGSRVGPTKHCRNIQMYDKYFHAVTVDKVELPETQATEVNSRVVQLCVARPENTVVTWSGYVEYKGSKVIRLLEKTWIVMEAIPLGKLGMLAMGERTHGTLMRVVVRLTPVETEYDLKKIRDVEEMANVVVSTYQRNGQRMLQAMLEYLRDSHQSR